MSSLRQFPLRAVLLLPLLLLAGCGALHLFDTVVPKDGGTRLAARDVAYGADPRQRLDVYEPAAGVARNGHVLVFIYGGSWTSGSRRDYSFVGRAFAARGFVTVISDYRLVPEVRYPAFVEDNAAAVAWAYRHARDFGAEPEKLVLAGHSAGAYGAVMLAVAPEFLARESLSPRIIKGVAALSGPYEFVPLAQMETQEAFKGVRNLAATQPINRLSRSRPVPPMLLLHGEADEFVRPSNSTNLARALRRTGHAAEVKLYPGIDHRGTLLALARPFRDDAPVLEDVVEFLGRQ